MPERWFMFGYVVVNKPELKIKDFDTYQSFYCGLCQQLKQRFGQFSRLALNYDMTFLAILLSGLYEPKTKERKIRCILHPAHKKDVLENTYITYAADMTVLLTYLKCQDDWEDEHSYKAKAFQKILHRQYQKVYEKYPEKCDIVIQALKESSSLEKENCDDLDRMCALSGKFMAEICCYKEDAWMPYLKKMGDYLGRFIYLLDAYDDVKKDKEKNLYNPLKNKDEKQLDTWIQPVLEMLIAESADAFEMLPILKYEDILRNILYSGVWARYYTVKKARVGEENGSL